MALTIINDIQKWKVLPVYSAGVYINGGADTIDIVNVESGATWNFEPIESSGRDLNGNTRIIGYRFSGELSCFENYISELENLYLVNHNTAYVRLGLGLKNSYDTVPSKYFNIGNPVASIVSSVVRVRADGNDDSRHTLTFNTILSTDIVTDTAKFNQFFLNNY